MITAINKSSDLATSITVTLLSRRVPEEVVVDGGVEVLVSNRYKCKVVILEKKKTDQVAQKMTKPCNLTT